MAQDEFAKLMALSAKEAGADGAPSKDAASLASASDKPLSPSLSIDPLLAMTKTSAATGTASSSGTPQPPAPPLPTVSAVTAAPSSAEKSATKNENAASDLPPRPATPAGTELSASVSSSRRETTDTAPPGLRAATSGAASDAKSQPTAQLSAQRTLATDVKTSATPSLSLPGVSLPPNAAPPTPSSGQAKPASQTTSDPTPVAGNLALSAPQPSPSDDDGADDSASTTTVIEPPPRRIARRRPAGPVRGKIAANDDVPSIGGLIYALEQKPSSHVFRLAGIASAIWAVIGITFATLTLAPKLSGDVSFGGLLLDPIVFYTAAAVLVPIAIFWLLALLNWHIASLSLKSSTMTEVAIRLAEPDRNAEQSIASLGQAVRRQVSFMNDAVSRALGRAGELEALVHNQVAELERSYEQNEQRIRGLIQELTGERHALLNTSNGVTDTLKTLGTEIPALIEKLSTQQSTLAGIIKGAGENLASLEGSLAQSTGRFESVLGDRTSQLQTVLEDYTSAFSTALEARTEHMRSAFDQYMITLDDTLGNRTGDLQAVFEEYARALDTTLSNRADALDSQLVSRTQSLDDAFQRRLELFEQQITNSTAVIDNAVSEKANLLTNALESHALSFRETMERQAVDLDESVMTGINAVRRSSENITLQTMRAIEGLSQQSAALQNVSENLFQRIEKATDRFESTNSRLDTTLQSRHDELARTLDKLSGKADEFGRTIADYSTGIEGSLTSMQEKARLLTHELRDGAAIRSRALIEELDRLKSQTEAEGQRKIDELRHRFTDVSGDLSREFSALTSQLNSASNETQKRAAEAAAQLAREQARIRDEAARLPASTRETAEAMRRALQDQMRALDQLSQISSHAHTSRDIAMPQPLANSGHVGRPDTRPAVSAQPAAGGRRSAIGAQRDGWSLGDLLARASTGESNDAPSAVKKSNVPVSQGASPGANGFRLDVGQVARAIDAATAANIWARIRAGQRGVMVRSLYAPSARETFDIVQQRLPHDADLRQTVTRYISDFERILNEAEAQDPTGEIAHSNIVSETGRVYLFLAHAAGRL